MKLLTLTICLFLSIMLVSSVSAASKPLKGKKILVDGDSFAVGKLAENNDGWYSYANYLESLGAKVDNVAVRGAEFYYTGTESQYKMSNHLTSSVKNTAYDYIILQGGDNDVDEYSNLNNTLQAIESYFRTVAANKKWKNAKKYFVITPHMERNKAVLEKANNLWQKVKKLCNKYSITCINFFKISKNDGNVVPDGFDYNLMNNIVDQNRRDKEIGASDSSHATKKAQIAMGKVIAEILTGSSNPYSGQSSSSNNSNSNSSANKNSNNSSSNNSSTSKKNSSKSSSSSNNSSVQDGTVETTFFGTIKDDGKGCGVFTILNTVIDIFSIGVGILSVVGIMVVGTQYLTAKGNEEQTKKAKRRLIEIIIGIVVYALLWSLINFLLPGGNFNHESCSTATSPSTTDYTKSMGLYINNKI